MTIPSDKYTSYKFYIYAKSNLGQESYTEVEVPVEQDCMSEQFKLSKVPRIGKDETKYYV